VNRREDIRHYHCAVGSQPPGLYGRGIILPIVLILFALLAMLSLGFGFKARAEYMGVRAREKMFQAHLCALSGLESAALMLRQKFTEHDLWYDNPDLFRDRIVHGKGGERQKVSWRFSLVGDNPGSDEVVRFGVTDEAGKLNINVASPDQLRRLLARYADPGRVETMVASLLDWREDGIEPRLGGAKDMYYMMLSQPYQCKNAPLDTIEELLVVKGFDSSIVFGEDMNRNGMLEENEDDGDESLPMDNGDGMLNRGIYPYITVYSREPEVSDSNPYVPRVNINLWPEGARERLDDEIVDFIVQAKDAKVDFGKTPASLVGMEFEKNDEKVASPAVIEDLPAIMDILTTGYHVSDDGFVYGRININTATRRVLRTIGKLTGEQVDGIIKTRHRLDGQRKKTIAWLVTENVMPVEEFKEVAYLFTARSYQFTVEALGYKDYDDIQCRLQAVMELRLPRVQYIYFRDLSGLGRSYNIGGFEEGHVIITQDISGSGL